MLPHFPLLSTPLSTSIYHFTYFTILPVFPLHYHPSIFISHTFITIFLFYLILRNTSHSSFPHTVTLPHYHSFSSPFFISSRPPFTTVHPSPPLSHPITMSLSSRHITLGNVCIYWRVSWKVIGRCVVKVRWNRRLKKLLVILWCKFKKYYFRVNVLKG